MKRAIGISLALLIILSGFSLYLPTPNAIPYSTPDTGVSWTMDDLVANSGGTVTGSAGAYVMTDHVGISKNDTLVISPGETIKFDTGVNLTISGTLNAQGIEANMITFTTNSSFPFPGSWGCIQFDDTSNDANCIIDYSIIEYSTYGIICEHASPTITNSTMTSNLFYGIACNVSSAIIDNNTISGSIFGISCGGPSKPIINNNNLSDNIAVGIICSGSDAEIYNNTITNSANGIYCLGSAPNITDCTITNSSQYAIQCENAAGINVTDNTLINNQMMFYNSTINKLGLIDSIATTVNCTYPIPDFDVDPNSILVVQNYLHVKVIDDGDAPMQGAWVYVADEGTQIFSGQTAADGFIRWIAVTDRVYYLGNIPTENQTGITVENGSWTFQCLTSPDPNDIGMYTSHVEVFNGTPGFGINLVYGWNLISIPLIQSDTGLGTVLNSISGDYNAVSCYNSSDISDYWKHYHTSKPPYMNDLSDIDHTMGFWIFITEPGGVLYQFPGTQPIENQTIPLNPGWNLVGYPSKTGYNRTEALNNLTFGTHIGSIWTYDSAAQQWEEVGEFDYFESGRGYWIHAKVEATWKVPL